MTRPTFQLNGRTYDAITGAVISTEAKNVQTAAPAAKASPTHQQPVASTSLRTGLRQPARHASGPSMDGMMMKPRPAAKPLATKQTATQTPKHVNPHRPQPTRTLMRRAVKAPSHAAATAQSATQQASHAATIRRSRGVAPIVTPKLSSSAINPRRAQLAGSTDRNQAVQRFAPAPQHKPWTGHAATTVSGVNVAQHRPAQTTQATIASIPVKQPAAHPHQKQAHSTFAKPTRRPSATVHQASAAKQQSSIDDDGKLFEQALAQARSHEQAAPSGTKSRKSRRRTGRVMAIAGAAAVFLGLIGFVAFQNQEDIRLQLASAKAGFSASAPLYKPDGYALSSMQYTAGSVASVYRHGTSQDFTITQKKSNWDSQTLLENFVATKSGDYKGYQMNGRSVYVYGDGNATWVNGGIWYQIKATGSIDDQQLVRIAASM